MKYLTTAVSIITLACALFAGAIPGSAEKNISRADKLTVAVLDLEARGMSKIAAMTVCDIIRSELIDSDRFLVVERNQMNVILKEQGLQQTGCTDSSCAVQIGKLLSARKVLIGEVNKLDTAIHITVRIVDVERGLAEFSTSEKAKSLDEIDIAAKSIVRKLTERITGRAIAAEKVKEEKETPISREEIKAGIVSRYPLARVSAGFMTTNYGMTEAKFGKSMNYSIDLFFYRHRFSESKGYDIFFRWRLYGGGDLRPEMARLNPADVSSTYQPPYIGLAAGGRYITGTYYPGVQLQPYCLLAYQYIRAIDYSGFNVNGVGDVEFKYNSPYGFLMGAGMEISPFRYFGFYIELDYGYNPAKVFGGLKNLDGLTFNFGTSFRAGSLM
jgi:hypothetical protein